MMSRPTGGISYGLIGAGAIAQAYLQVLQQSTRDRLAAVADLQRGAADAVAELAGCPSFGSHWELAAESDCDAVSIARIAKAAECSVGAFYERFLDKNAFLLFLIRNSFRTKTNNLENSLPEIAHKKSTRKSIIEEIAEFLVEELSGEKTTGVIRVAFKLAPMYPEALTPITEYRAAANKIICEILKPHIKGRDARNRVEEALQIVFAVIFDAIQQNYGPLQFNNARMSAVLSRQFEARITDKSKLPKGAFFNSTE